MTASLREGCSRRALLLGGAAVALSPGLAFAGASPHTLVCVFLRGAVDGLSLVVPYGDAEYYAARPSIALARPRQPGGVLDLDGRFGLHPRLAALKPLYDRAELGLVHAIGSPDPTRSHFDAQDYMETATPGERRNDGWLTRALPAPLAETLPCVAFADRTPLALRGAPGVLSTPSLDGFQLRAPERLRGRLESAWAELYAADTSPAARAGSEALALAHRVRTLSEADRTPGHGADYGRGAAPLRDVAKLIKANLGLRVACVDLGGWDTHQGQGNAERGRLAPLLHRLGQQLAAFRRDLGERFEHVTVLVMTEFGRTVRENGTQGTDHGHGSVMLALGGQVRGRRVYGTLPSLAEGTRYDGRDVPVTTDFRAVFAEVLAKRFGRTDLDVLLPGFDAAANPELALLV